MFASRTAIAILALVALTGAATAQPVVAGRATLSYQLLDDEDFSSRGLHQIYDVIYARNVLEPLRLRLSFRGEGTDTTQQFSGFDQKSSVWLLQPGAEVDYLLPKLTLQARYDLYDTRSSVDEASGTRKVERAYGNLLWSPEAAPSLALQATQRTDRDLSAGLDQKESRILETMTYKWRGVTLSQTGQYADFGLGGSGFDRRTIDLQGQIRFEGSRADGRVSLSAYGLGGVTRLDETGGSSSVSVPTQVPISAGLYARDDTPLDSRDNPPLAEPKMADGDLTGRTSVGLGPRDPLYQNLVADMGRVVALDTFRVVIRDPSGNPVPTRGLVRWDVFTSENALDWTPLLSGAQTNFIFALSAYEVTFVKTSSRYFKLVSFGTNSADAFVTELQAYFHTAIAKGETRRTDVRFVSGNVNLAVQPVSWLAVRYYGLLNSYATTQADRADYNSRDDDHLLSVDVAPNRPLSATLRYERRRFTAGKAADQSSDDYRGIVQYVANRNLQTTLEASRTSDHGSQEITTDTVRLHQYVRFFRALEFSVDGGVSNEEFPLQQLSGRHLFANGVSYILLTRSIRLTLLANYEKTRFAGAGAALLTDTEPRNARYYGEVFFRPSSQLALSGRLGYVTGTFVSATTKTYRIEWYPFAHGTIGLGTTYDEDIETNGTYRRFRRVQILPRWQVNRHVTMDVNYNYLTLFDGGLLGSAPVETKTKQLYINLTWIL